MKITRDVLIIGGGPAGSTLASFLVKEGLSVLIAEKSQGPRYHIGESLVPQVLDVLEESGVLPKVESAGFLRKEGGIFKWGKSPEPWSFYFDEIKNRYKHTYAYQVIRSEFDQILLNHAQSIGTEVIRGATAKEFSPEGKTQKVFLTKESNRIDIEAKIVADCSGQAGWLANKLLIRQYDEFLKNIAIFGYFTGAQKLSGRDANGIFCESTHNGWLWNIPLDKETNSVGFVAKAKKKDKLSIREIYENEIKNSTHIGNLLRNTEGPITFEGKSIRTIQDYSYTSKRLVGPGYIIVGDAGNFIDPVWSTGVFLSTTSAKMAAHAISKKIKEKDERALPHTKNKHKNYMDFIETLCTFSIRPMPTPKIIFGRPIK